MKSRSGHDETTEEHYSSPGEGLRYGESSGNRCGARMPETELRRNCQLSRYGK